MKISLLKRLIKKKNYIPVGIHVRKGDYIQYEKSLNIPNVLPEFYVKSMNQFKTNLGKKVAFILITDDIQWCKENIPSRKDLFIATDQSLTNNDSIGHDLAIMSLCQHSIVSRGTFSRWAKFLAGGKSISPHDL